MAAKSASMWATHHASLPPPPARPLTRLRLSTSAAATAVFLGGLAFSLSLRPCSAAIVAPPLLQQHLSSQVEEEEIKSEGTEKEEERKVDDNDDDKAFEAWKSKTYALTVPLRIVALRGSVPPSWIKEFMQSQGKRLKFQLKLSGSLEGIFSDLSTSLIQRKFKPSSIVAADLISVGDSWLSHAIKKAVIEPIDGVEDQDWFKELSSKWKVYLRRNSEGDIDREGKVWAAPYRWGCMVIAYKKTKFRKQNLAPIEDWKDLWRPELAGRISMVDSPREVVGAVLKYMGASYNTNNIDAQVAGGKTAVSRNIVSLANQVRLFDSTNYLKAFGVGDVWVAVGWSSDVLPIAKRMSNVAVIVPKSGASLWADLWAIPASTGLETNRIGGRVRGPSPLLHQWVEFCLQAARAIPFKQEVVPGASPSALENVPRELLSKGKPKLDTNLVAGIPPPDILAKCEFLEPLSDSTLSEYQWLISSVEKADNCLVRKVSSLIRTLWLKLNFKTA